MLKKNRGQHATLIDVAREAGVSVSTAARVLRSSKYPVTEDLQKRVRKASEKVGYVPNLLAKKLRGGEHPSIGLIVGNMLDPFFGGIAQNVSVAANQESLLAIVANMQRDPKLELAMVRELWEHRVNGLILSGGGFDQVTHQEELGDLVKQLRRSGIVVVSLSERGIAAPVFSVDQVVVGAMLAQCAIESGHREIGIAAGPANSLVTQQRLTGTMKALKKSGVKPAIVHTEFGISGGVDVAKKLLDMNPRMTMVLANADTHGVGIVQGLVDRGLRVPDDVSVISAGNTAYARLCTPELASIDIGVKECCEAAVQYIAAALKGSSVSKGQLFTPKYVPGKSVRKLDVKARSTARVS